METRRKRNEDDTEMDRTVLGRTTEEKRKHGASRIRHIAEQTERPPDGRQQVLHYQSAW